MEVNGNGRRSPSPSTARSLDLYLTGGELITVDLDQLPDEEEEFSVILGVLTDAECGVIEWTRIGQEYWRTGRLSFAEQVANAGVSKFESIGRPGDAVPLHYLLANISFSYGRLAPKHILPNAIMDPMGSKKTKNDYQQEAAKNLNRAGAVDSDDVLGFLTRGLYLLSNREYDNALSTFEGILTKRKNNLVALMGKARVYFAKKQYRDALKTLQHVLTVSPNSRPDPRVSMGLCYWALNDRDKARRAWDRSLEVDPTNSYAKLLVGICSINQSKEMQADTLRDQQTRRALFDRGSTLLTSVFRNEKSSAIIAAAANALSEISLRQDSPDVALKLAERAVQYADTLTVISDSHLRAARACHYKGLLDDATNHYQASLENSNQPYKVLSWIGRAQMHIQADEFSAAIHALDTLVTNRPDCLEAMLVLASLYAHPRPALSSADALADRTKARDLFEKIVRVTSTSKSLAVKGLVEDWEMHADIARLWQSESLEKARKAYIEAARLEMKPDPDTGAGIVDPRLSNNVGVIRHLEGEYVAAQTCYQDALTVAVSSASENDGVITSVMYNLARVLEEQGETSRAREAYDKLLGKHPEYIDAKVARARMAHATNRLEDAYRNIKEALESHPDNFNIRAFYTWLSCDKLKMAKQANDFISSTLKMNANDLYHLCAYGLMQHHQAREDKPQTEEAKAERAKMINRALSSFSTVLEKDPFNAVAAQGIAIILAEDTLGLNESQSRISAMEALGIFNKVKETLVDGNVYINMGHCHFTREEFEKAIECYETALLRCHGTNYAILLYLCRTYYARAVKNRVHSDLKLALKFAQQALHIKGQDDQALLFNIAIIEQKTLDMITQNDDPSKRTLVDVELAIAQAKHAHKLFTILSSDTVPKYVPYNKDLADQRRRYCETMLRKGEDLLARQQEYEREHQTQVEQAKRVREQEAERQRAKLAAAQAAERQKEEALVLERRAARETALQWAAQYKSSDDEEDEKKPKRSRAPKQPKVKAEDGAEDGAPSEPKKKKRTLKKRASANPVDGEGGIDEEGDEPMNGVFSEPEDNAEQKPKKPRAKKRVVQDEEDDEAGDLGRKKRKTEFKSKEYISDSDEEQ